MCVCVNSELPELQSTDVPINSLVFCLSLTVQASIRLYPLSSRVMKGEELLGEMFLTRTSSVQLAPITLIPLAVP